MELQYASGLLFPDAFKKVHDCLHVLTLSGKDRPEPLFDRLKDAESGVERTIYDLYVPHARAEQALLVSGGRNQVINNVDLKLVVRKNLGCRALDFLRNSDIDRRSGSVAAAALLGRFLPRLGPLAIACGPFSLSRLRPPALR
jgi:hypothetical protein